MPLPRLNHDAQRFRVREKFKRPFVVEMVIHKRLGFICSKDLDLCSPWSTVVGEVALDAHLLHQLYARIGVEPMRARDAIGKERNQSGEHHQDGESAAHGVFSGGIQPSISGFTRTRKPTRKPSTAPSTAASGR